jgi:hypothetical protein
LEFGRASLLLTDGGASALAGAALEAPDLFGFEGSNNCPLDLGLSADVESSTTFAEAERLVFGGAVRLFWSLRAATRGGAAGCCSCAMGIVFDSAAGFAAGLEVTLG